MCVGNLHVMSECVVGSFKRSFNTCILAVVVNAANNGLRRFTLITVIAVSVYYGTGFTVDR